MNNTISDATALLLLNRPWYGTFLSGVSWKEDSKLCPTMGVYIHSGEIRGVYNQSFIDDLNIKELATILMHEADHIIRVHCVRRIDRHPEAWNYAADMIVNGPRQDPHLILKDKCHLPKSVVFNIFDESKTTEEIYTELLKNVQTCPACGGDVIVLPDEQGEDKAKGEGQGDGQGEQGDGQGGRCPCCGRNHYDDHSMWDKSNCSEEEARRMIADRVDQTTKAVGSSPGHLEEAIKHLQKVRLNPASLFREYLGKKTGGKRLCYSRPNRRTTIFGVPGSTSRALCDISIVVDTSGSITKVELGQFFGIIERFSSRFHQMRLIQFDVGITSVTKYRRGAWRRIKVVGRGGTNLITTLDEMEEQHLIADVNVVLTDGYLEWPEQKPYTVLFAITKGGCEPPSWGKVIEWN